MTDAVDQDSGHYVTGSNWEFRRYYRYRMAYDHLQAKVKSELDKTIRNIGKITGDNIAPQEPEKSIVIEPKDPKLETERSEELTAR